MPWSCWRGCCHAGFHGDFSTWREMEMTGSASEVTERSWRPPSAVAGGTALPALRERAAGTGRSPGSLRASGSPSLYRAPVAASCPGDAEPAHHICPSLAPPGKPVQVLTPALCWPPSTASTGAPMQVCAPGSTPSTAFPFPVGLSPRQQDTHPSLWHRGPPAQPGSVVPSSSLQLKEMLQAGAELAPGQP